MTPKQQMMFDYLDGKLTNVEIIEAWDRQRNQSERYKQALEEIAKETGTPYADIAIKALEG